MRLLSVFFFRLSGEDRKKLPFSIGWINSSVRRCRGGVFCLSGENVKDVSLFLSVGSVRPCGVVAELYNKREQIESSYVLAIIHVSLMDTPVVVGTPRPREQSSIGRT